MRQIKKIESPNFFYHLVSNLHNWHQFRDGKRKLRRYILEKEQKYLCAYCEMGIEVDNSHLEHIRPQSKSDKKVFDYYNLIVSCNGRDCAISFLDNEEMISCGHKKADNYNDNLFISPVDEKECEKFFAYDKDSGKILPSFKNNSFDRERAIYTISILALDNIRLNQSRLNARRSLEKELLRIKREEGFNAFKSKAYFLLSTDNKKKKFLPFISFLKYCFYGTKI